MKTLPLFPDTRVGVELETPCALPTDKPCGKCKATGEISPVAPVYVAGTEASLGTLLVVGEQVTAYESSKHRPFSSDSNRAFVSKLREQWAGPIVLDNALRCPTSDGKAVSRCRPYLSGTFVDVGPSKVICLGARAAQSVLGRRVDPLRLRKNHAFLSTGGGSVPVYTLVPPAHAAKNRFLLRWLYEDLAWAISHKAEDHRALFRVSQIETDHDAEAAYHVLRGAGEIAWDVETAGLMFDPSFRIVSISFWPRSPSGQVSPNGFVFRLGRADYPAYWIRKILTLPVVKTGSNVKYDIQAVKAALGFWPTNVTTDVRLVRKLQDAESPGDLDSMMELVGIGGAKEEHDADLKRVITEYKENPKLAGDLEFLVRDDNHEPEKWAYALTREDISTRYVGRDALGALLLSQHLDVLETWEQRELRKSLVDRVPIAFAQMETWGVPVDREALANLETLLTFEEEKAMYALKAYGPGVDWGSHKQVATFLYNDMGLPILKYTDKGAPSTDADTLELLNESHPHDALTALLEWRRISKLRGTYATGLRPHIRPSGRVHPTILPDGARSGRTSCVDPNLQNIPRPDSREGKMVRDVFVSSPGYLLVELDYSQLELRIAAMLSQDPVMLGIYNAGVDFHQRTAELISQVAWKIPPEQVEDKHRTLAKSVNFGIAYGKTATTFAAELGISKREAQVLVDAIMGHFTVFAAWKREALRDARVYGEAWTLWNGQRARRRPLWRIGSALDGERITAENGSGNSPIQGTASDYCVASICGIVDWILSAGIPAKLILAVHDSIMLEVREDYVDEVITECRNIMEGWPTEGVKLKADVKVGKSWGSMQKRK